MIKDINSIEAYKILQVRKDSVLVDVRSQMEYEYVGHPLGAIHIPIKEPPQWEIITEFKHNVGTILTKQFPDIDDLLEIQLLLICRSGKRSAEAAEILNKDGFRGVFNINDGFEGNKDKDGHRNSINGWRFNNLPWEQS